jgi:hypothetical protein
MICIMLQILLRCNVHWKDYHWFNPPHSLLNFSCIVCKSWRHLIFSFCIFKDFFDNGKFSTHCANDTSQHVMSWKILHASCHGWISRIVTWTDLHMSWHWLFSMHHVVECSPWQYAWIAPWSHISHQMRKPSERDRVELSTRYLLGLVLF